MRPRYRVRCRVAALLRRNLYFNSSELDDSMPHPAQCLPDSANKIIVAEVEVRASLLF
jgi:hypothetical protein